MSSGDSMAGRRRLRIASVDAVGESTGDMVRGAVCGLCLGEGSASWLWMCAEGEGSGCCRRRRMRDLVLRPIGEEL